MQINLKKVRKQSTAKAVILPAIKQKVEKLYLVSALSILVLLVVLIISNQAGMT